MIKEQEFTYSEIFEFQRRLFKLKSYLNEKIIPKMDDFFINNSLNKQSRYTVNTIYYVGGTLFLDLISDKSSGLITLNISDETMIIKVGNETKKTLMSIPALLFAFNIYKDVKGYHLKYYRDCYKNSCIRHIYNLFMEKHIADSKTNAVSQNLTDFLFDNFSFENETLFSEPNR
jgi:hypothetical protein